PVKTLAVGDFNSDGKLDLVVAGGTYLTVLLGTGTGAFQSQALVNFTTGNVIFKTLARSIAVEDFNGDGKRDLAVANQSGPSTSVSISMLSGTGTGAFQFPLNYAAGKGTDSVAVGDFNGDRKPDLAVANSGSKNVSVLLNTGDGTFQAHADYAVDY